ncbi:MAG: virulence RhuM family protein [Muribaculaceae bacterium]|nr:virulence RhuM family protein [Muribaculaceae bacterium]
MEQEPQLNAHNKAEFPPMQVNGFDTSSIMIYVTEDNQISLDVKMDGETVWLSQSQMALLFDTDRTSILRHIKNIYKIGELEENSTCAKIAQVRMEGKRQVTREIPFYNLDMIISVGYRVNSIRGTQFRIWANRVLKDYLIKGYAINDKLKLERYNGKSCCEFNKSEN